jgi:hypothetical protein
MDVAAWLRELGLERYEQNEIDAEVLPELTEFDLSPLGLPIGPRPKLLKAVTALGCRYSIGNGVTGVYPRSKPADIGDFAVISRASVFSCRREERRSASSVCNCCTRAGPTRIHKDET